MLQTNLSSTLAAMAAPSHTLMQAILMSMRQRPRDFRGIGQPRPGIAPVRKGYRWVQTGEQAKRDKFTNDVQHVARLDPKSKRVIIETMKLKTGIYEDLRRPKQQRMFRRAAQGLPVHA